VLARYVRNRRLADAIFLWAFSSLNSSPGSRAYYDARRAAGDGHHQAMRALGTVSLASSMAALFTMLPTMSNSPGPIDRKMS
jgi:hypothetical protein